MNTVPIIGDFMTPAPVAIAPGLSLDQARQRMFDTRARHLPVVDDSGALVGILSERDIALLEAVPPANPERCTVAHAMTLNPFTCGAHAHLHAVATEMADHKYGAAVVVDPEHPSQVIGLFTTVDALRALALHTGHDPDPRR